MKKVAIKFRRMVWQPIAILIILLSTLMTGMFILDYISPLTSMGLAALLGGSPDFEEVSEKGGFECLRVRPPPSHALPRTMGEAA